MFRVEGARAQVQRFRYDNHEGLRFILNYIRIYFSNTFRN